MPTHTAPARLLVPLIGALLLLIGGCAKDPPTSANFRIAAAEYSLYFENAKEVLRDQQFDLERVDARAGVLTTMPAASAGWATPWIDHADTFTRSTTDLIQRNRRIATVRFLPVVDETNRTDPVDPVGADLRNFQGTIEVSISVLVEQVYRPGRRLAPASIRLTTFTDDPRNESIGAQRLETRIVGSDARLAARLASELLAK